MKIKIDRGNLYYDDWQIQCCGEPIQKDTRVELTIDQHRPRMLGGMHIDFSEDHHGSSFYNIQATIARIQAVFVDMKEGTRNIHAEENTYTSIDIDYFDGYEKPEPYNAFEERPYFYILELNDIEISKIDKENLKVLGYGDKLDAAFCKENDEDDFRIEIGELEAGWEHITLVFNGIRVPFHASYLGREPLSTLIKAVESLDDENSALDDEYSMSWYDEPGKLDLGFHLDRATNQLDIDIWLNKDDTLFNDFDGIENHWHIEMEYQLFREAVIQTALWMLKQHGILGFSRNWDSFDSNTFPIGSLLYILGKRPKTDKKLYTLKPDIDEELLFLWNNLSSLGPIID